MINYTPIEKIHISDHGSLVLKVKNMDTEEVCVLKLIGQISDKLNKLIFKREVAALRKLNQFDDIVKIYDSSDQLRYNKQSGYGSILLELIDGQPLNTVDFSAFSDLEKINICRNAACAVLHAHQCDVLHRDIKPSNIMLIEGTNKVKMIDFGSSKLKTIVDEGTTHHFFSEGYVAPEVARGMEATEVSDIYSLGAVFYNIFFSSCPPTNEKLEETIASTGIVPDMQALLLKMLMPNPADRFDNMQVVVDLLDTIIGALNTNAFNYWFYIDSRKLINLKRQYTVENAMTYQQFLSAYLPKEFSTIYGIYNTTKNIYEFIGNSLFMECVYNEPTRQFQVANLYEIAIDKRSKLQRNFGIIEGKKGFVGFGVNISGKNDNNKLKTQLHNYADERNSLEAKNELFEDIFGKWRQSLQESIGTIKDKGIQIEYGEFWFEQDKLSLSIESIKGVDIDGITQEVSFLFDTPDNPKRKTMPIGSFDDYYYNDEQSILILKLDRYATQEKLTPLLQNKVTILEDYTKKIGALKKQLIAITALKNGDYNTAGLKDIILELASPTFMHSIQSLKFYLTLNDSQKQAVSKSIYSNSISLIQGPPGTGKTSVITELIQQVMVKASVSDTQPKILVVSQSHTAVDNILEKLSLWEGAQNLKIVRIGKNEDVSANVASRYLIGAIKDGIYENIQVLSSKYVDEKIELLSPNYFDSEMAAESKKLTLKTWTEAKAIHEDWLKRCGDYDSLRYQIVNTATIIAGTCIGFLSDENVRDMIFDYVIVDEAAKATTPELLVSIIKAEKIVLVGDQNQLSPFADGTLSELAVTLVKDPKYRLFDILYESLPDTHKQFLATQYRMHSTIGNLISTVFYDGKIITGVSDQERQHTVSRFTDKAIVWINTAGVQNHDSKKVPGGSSYNQTEVNIIRRLLAEMNGQDDANNLDIGIITAYKAQKESINKAYRNGSYKNIGNVDINTLDAFQGRENDIIIYSTVRTGGNIVFLQEKERVNVAFSRAKKLLIICGDMDFIETWTGAKNYFVEIVQYLRSNTDTCQIIDAREVLQ